MAALVAWRRGPDAQRSDEGQGRQTHQDRLARDREPQHNQSLEEGLHAGNGRMALPSSRANRIGEAIGSKRRRGVRELHDGEEAAIGEAMRGDYGPWVQFALMTGLRRAETLLRWSDVNWSAKTITRPGKGGRLVSTPITDEVAALIEPLKGDHPEYVFTYAANRTRDGRVKGQRYPITYEGGKTEWRRLMKRAGVANFRFHDLRHTTATRLLRETGNLKLVQRALNHRDIATTARYGHVLDEEVTDALQRVAKCHGKSHGTTPGVA